MQPCAYRAASIDPSPSMTPPSTASSCHPAPERGSLATSGALLPYLWPAGRADLKIRVVAAILCLFVAKAATVYVPLLYKDAIDALNTGTSNAMSIPLGLILAYGGARVLALLFSQLRDAIFAKVGPHAIRTVGLELFRHLHSLALHFHLSRRTEAA
jgi:ATP-binding cassette, subfamily B, heavy metal transporter